MKKHLPNVAMLGIDCVKVGRLQRALDISSQEMEFASVKLLTSLSTDDPRKVEIPSINSLEEFSEFCVKDLYKYIDTDYVLLVQYDGFILNVGSWEDEFLNYDYIGAPWLVAVWSVRDFNFPESTLGTKIVGNGGFSIRSKKFLETTSRLAKEGVFKKYHPEDVAMCVWYRDKLEANGIKFAPVDLALRFSIEGSKRIYEKEFGFHGLKHTDIRKWIEKNPQWGIKQIPKEKVA
jgi:hypothetical protein